MSRSKIIVAATVICVTLLFIFLSFSSSNPSNIDADKEPEGGGPAVVSVDNTYKLNALLSTSRFYFVKDQISTYVAKAFGSKELTATIKKVTLNSDSNMEIIIEVPGKKTFSAIVTQSASSLSFSVPSNDYRVVGKYTDINSEYGNKYE